MNIARKSFPVAWSPAFCCYIGTLFVCCASLVAGTYLNPRDMAGYSWTDPYLQAASTWSFLGCLVTPWFIRVSWFRRFRFFCVGLAVAFGAFWWWYVTCA